MVTPPQRHHRNHGREKKPFQQQRTNPFASRNNYNFPGLDNAFDSTKKTSPDRQSSMLDISIGAHAAINEQTRHVAQFGLDGTNQTKVSHQWSGDYEWDHLLDETNVSHVSYPSTCVTDTEPNIMHPGQSFVSQLRNNASVLDENEPLDMTCDQSDFFSSSRVCILTTPEKNKPKVDEASRLARLGVGMANNRDKENTNPNYSESISGSTDASADFNGSGMLGFFNAALRLENDGQICEDNNDAIDNAQDSFITYQDPDLSIISPRNSRSAGKSSGEKTNNYFQEDAQSSFISYAEPDLSILSNRDINLIKSKSTDARSLAGQANSPIARTFVDSEELFFNIKKYPKSCQTRDFGHLEFDADMSEIIAPSDFQQRQLNASPNSMTINGCLVPATDNGDNDDNQFRDFDQDTRFVSTTVRNETLNNPNQLFMEKSSCATPQRNTYSKETGAVNNFSGGETVDWYCSSPTKDGYQEKTIAAKSKSSDEIKLRHIGRRPTIKQSLGTADEKVQITPTSSPNKEVCTPPTSKSFFSGLSPISNHVRGYSSNEDGNESPLSVNKSLFCTTLTEIQTQLSSEEALKSHLQAAASVETFHSDTIASRKDSTRRKHDEAGHRNTGYSQHAHRRSGLAERYSRPDRFEDSFTAVKMGVGPPNRDISF